VFRNSLPMAEYYAVELL